jgi:hypothetical protein
MLCDDHVWAPGWVGPWSTVGPVYKQEPQTIRTFLLEPWGAWKQTALFSHLCQKICGGSSRP